MPGRITRLVCEIVAVLAALSVFAYMAYRYSGHVGLIVHGQPMFGDFIAFWSAGHLALQGEANMVHDPHAIFRAHTDAIPGLHVMAPWNSPPTFLLICTALARLPYPVAALTFLSVSWIVYIIAARKVLPDARALILAVTVPAAVYQLGSIQIAVLLAGISALALLWMDKRPLTAGALVSLLAVKPHIAILWPVMLALSGRWKAFAAATVCTAAFVVTAGLVFGFETYANFIENFQRATNLITERRVSTFTFGSLYGSFITWRAPQNVAVAAQAISAIAALCVAGFVFRKGTRETQAAALCAATLLMSPYLFFYDFALLAVGAAMLGRPRNWWELPVFIFAWGAGLSVAAGRIVPLPICPVAAWLVLSTALVRTLNPDPVKTETEAADLAPAPQL